MELKKIKICRWYETVQGIGECLAVGGTRPVSICFRISHPVPRGVVYLKPRDVLKEVPRPSAAKAIEEEE